MPVEPRIRRTPPRDVDAVRPQHPPIPVFAAIHWLDHGPDALPIDAPALAVAWARDPDVVLIRWQYPAGWGSDREDWIEAKHVHRLE